MDSKTFRDLERGDLVRSKTGHRTFVVTGNHGNHVTAVATVDMTNLLEWELIRKARKPEEKFRITVIERAKEEKRWTHSVRHTLEEAEKVRRELEKMYPKHTIEISDRQV